eukprot:367132_1
MEAYHSDIIKTEQMLVYNQQQVTNIGLVMRYDGISIGSSSKMLTPRVNLDLWRDTIDHEPNNWMYIVDLSHLSALYLLHLRGQSEEIEIARNDGYELNDMDNSHILCQNLNHVIG